MRARGIRRASSELGVGLRLRDRLDFGKAPRLATLLDNNVTLVSLHDRLDARFNVRSDNGESTGMGSHSDVRRVRDVKRLVAIGAHALTHERIGRITVSWARTLNAFVDATREGLVLCHAALTLIHSPILSRAATGAASGQRINGDGRQAR